MSSAPISQTVGIGDPDKPANTIQVNDDRSINVVVTSGGGGSDVNLVEVGGSAIALGQATMANSLPVVIASNQSGLPVAGASTPSDNFANPTTAVPTFALSGVWDGSNWDRAPGTSADGALVNLGANNDVTLNAGQNSIGNVGGKTVAVTVTPPVTATNAYGVNYVVGGLLTFSNAFTTAGSGIIQTVTVTIAKVETVAFTLYLFNANPSNTTWTDAAVAAINAADVAKVRPPIVLTNASQLGTHTVSYAAGIGEAMNVGSTTLYGVLIVSGALTNQFGSTSDMTVTVTILQDLYPWLSPGRVARF